MDLRIESSLLEGRLRKVAFLWRWVPSVNVAHGGPVGTLYRGHPLPQRLGDRSEAFTLNCAIVYRDIQLGFVEAPPLPLLISDRFLKFLLDVGHQRIERMSQVDLQAQEDIILSRFNHRKGQNVGLRRI